MNIFRTGILVIILFLISSCDQKKDHEDVAEISPYIVTQPSFPAGRGNHNERIMLINIKTGYESTPGVANAITLTIGNTPKSVIEKVIIYYTKGDKKLNTNNEFGQANPTEGKITITGTQDLKQGHNYFWITYNISMDAKEGDVIDATCESVTVNNQSQAMPNPEFPGNREILMAHKVLYSGGDYGSGNYRIPAICTGLDGTLITAADKRIDPSDLPGNIDITIRRSTDNGDTWSEPIIAADFGSFGASDPALVVDKNTGAIILLFASHSGLFASTPSNKIRFNVSRSVDNGFTWSEPKDLSDQIYSSWHAAWVASGSAHQLRSGRIVAVAGVRPDESRTLKNHMIYSDDGGESWSASMGTPNPAGGGDESKIVELDNGDLLMNIRSSGGYRKTSISSDGGETWSPSKVHSQLVDPRVNADLIRYTSVLDGYDKSRLLFSNPRHPSQRKNLHVYLSTDEGATWPAEYSKRIYADLSGYSSLTKLEDGTIGLFYENGEFELYQLYFARFSLSWLTDGKDKYLSK